MRLILLSLTRNSFFYLVYPNSTLFHLQIDQNQPLHSQKHSQKSNYPKKLLKLTVQDFSLLRGQVLTVLVVSVTKVSLKSHLFLSINRFVHDRIHSFKHKHTLNVYTNSIRRDIYACRRHPSISNKQHP